MEVLNQTESLIGVSSIYMHAVPSPFGTFFHKLFIYIFVSTFLPYPPTSVKTGMLADCTRWLTLSQDML